MAISVNLLLRWFSYEGKETIPEKQVPEKKNLVENTHLVQICTKRGHFRVFFSHHKLVLSVSFFVLPEGHFWDKNGKNCRLKYQENVVYLTFLRLFLYLNWRF